MADARARNIPPPVLDANYPTDGSSAWKSGHASNLMPEVCEERCIDLQGPSYLSTLLGSSEKPEVRQRTNDQIQINNASPGIGYGADNFYEDENGANEYLGIAYSTALKTAGLESNAVGNHEEACTIPSSQDLSPSFPYNIENGSLEKHCTCTSCLEVCNVGTNPPYQSKGLTCRFPSCQKTSILCHSDLRAHERRHYGQAGKYTCLEQDCHTITKHFGDLRRHYKTKHCISAEKEHYACPISWCKYSGNNGFARKDKLKSHYKNIHEGKPGLAKASRVIKPAKLKPQVSTFVGSAGK